MAVRPIQKAEPALPKIGPQPSTWAHPVGPQAMQTVTVLAWIVVP